MRFIIANKSSFRYSLQFRSSPDYNYGPLKVKLVQAVRLNRFGMNFMKFKGEH